MVNCELSFNCWGIDCCLDLIFIIFLGDIKVIKNIFFWFKLDFCDFFIDIGFGIIILLRIKFLIYEYGMEIFLNLFFFYIV